MTQNTYVRTAYELERKLQSSLVGIKKAVQQSSTGLTKVENELNNFVIQTAEDIKELQSQVDGNVTTWFFYGVPTLKNQPAIDWGTSEFPNHVGDLYYDKDTGYCYKFTFENNTYSWTKQENTAISEVLAISNAAQDTADSKRRVFVIQPKPPYDAGDLWLVESGEHQGELFRCQVSRPEEETFVADDWIVATKYTDDTTANSVKDALNDYKTLVAKDYATKVELQTTEDSFEASVESVKVLANEKAKVFKPTEAQPVPQPPYNKDDIFIDGTNIYTCIATKLVVEIEGEEVVVDENGNASDYAFETDWELNLNGSDYYTRAEFEISDREIRAEVSSIADNVNDLTKENGVIDQIEQSVTQIQTDTYTKTEINTKLTDGSVTKVKSTSGTFDENGMHYLQSNAKTGSTINHLGLEVNEVTQVNGVSVEGNDLLFAGYVDGTKVDSTKPNYNAKLKDFEGQSVVYTRNVITDNYFVIGSHSRLEDYEDGTGIFYIGG